jgi:hypothetical protein
MVENIEALQNWSAYTNGSLPAALLIDDSIGGEKLNFAKTGADGIWWEELGRTTLVAAGDTISCASLPVRKYLRILFSLQASGAIVPTLRFNNDSGNNYAERYLFSGSFGSSTSVTNIGNLSNSGAVPGFGFADIENIQGITKHGVLHDCFADNTPATAPDYIDFWFKWCNTSAQISRIDMINTGAGDFAIGSQLVVLGHN